MICSPLVGSACLPTLNGNWRCESRFSKAINLCFDADQLLTLHRHGHGFSPMGWILSNNDFDTVWHRLPPGKQGDTQNGGLNISSIQVIKPKRVLSLSLRPEKSSQSFSLRQHIINCTAQTGLCGALNLAVDATSDIKNTFFQQFSHWAQGEIPNWREIIGLGPGLTPSGDDMLVGAMAVFHTLQSTSERLSHQAFIPNFETLLTLTPSVSAHYLNYARQGYFSSPVLRVIRNLLHSPTKTEHALRNLLAHGHTSGTDTLLGMHLALLWLTGHHTKQGMECHV